MARKNRIPKSTRGNASPRETAMRIIGGRLRGRKLKYAGDKRVRPMKDRVREAVFNLVGPAVADMFAIDLFGGTGALALESISRGATGAVIVEQHLPSAKIIRENVDSLELGDVATLVRADVFQWLDNAVIPTDAPWLVFCAPPYRFFSERRAELIGLLETIVARAPCHSLIVVEATDGFDFTLLPRPDAWDVRCYPPAFVGILEVVES